MVDWKKIPKIDAHIHLTPKDVIAANIDYDGRFIVNGSIDDYESMMKKYNIECAVIMPFNDPYMLSMEFTAEAVNKNMKNMICDKEGGFYCFADLDIKKDIEDMLSELEQVLMQKEFIGIKLHSSNTGYPIDGDYYEQIIKYANDHKILIESIPIQERTYGTMYVPLQESGKQWRNIQILDCRLLIWVDFNMKNYTD